MMLPLATAAALLLNAAPALSLDMCRGGDRAARKVTCLVDGDTGWENGVKWRLKGIDTPEYPQGRPDCEAEVEYAKAATFRMLSLMRAGYSIEWMGESDGSRELVRIHLADGRDAGTILIEEGFAVHWPHPDGVWCVSKSPRD